jgi:D-alanine-D-alanine ligase
MNLKLVVVSLMYTKKMKCLFILSGGVGNEREVSLASGRNVIETLREEGVICEEVIVGKDKSFSHKGKVMTENEGLDFLKSENALVFQVIHGTYGEDGELIGKLEDRGVSYIGSSQKVLELTIDKYETEKVLRENDISTTKSVLVRQKLEAKIDVSFPCIVKPNKEGSSVGVMKAKNQTELDKAVLVLLQDHHEVLVQKCVTGREFSCGVVEIDGELVALPATEIILTKGEMFDYDAKYTVNGCREVTPAEVNSDLAKRIQDTALKVHTITGCKDISRTDMILNEKGDLVVLEINTVPGMTKTSFVPEQMRVERYTLSGFINGMIKKYS